jgi:enoyl-CoA hydratase/carnithine racemase
VVNRIAKPGAVRDAAIAWAEDLGKISPNATARIKTLIAAAGAQPLAEHLIAERDNFVASLHHGDALEGITAFLEKRAPKYK